LELIQLNISAIRQSDAQNNAYVMLLNETVGKRQLPVVIGWCEARAIAVALDSKEKTERPLTHDLFKTFGDKFNISVSKMVIHKLIEGVFHSTLYCKNLINSEEIEIDSRTSDAIAIAIRFSCPIFTYEDILSRASILSVSSFDKENIKSTIDHKEKKINKYSLKELQESLKQAIKVENYEKASKIRDEIKRRTS
jgi:bifunctional DNase/RNase|tara:strand:- start:530 stop:1114 length:585 start_codon:yes stop_codon:yes gene_type:complete